MTFGWDYPPGVTGYEGAIAGGDEREVDGVYHECKYEYPSGAPCDFEGEVDVTRVFWEASVEDYWDCPGCNHANVTDVTQRVEEEEQGDREDAEYDRMKEDDL